MATEPAVDGLVMRELDQRDFHKGYLQLLGQLTCVEDVSEASFAGRCKELEALPDYKVLVLEDPSTSTIVGTATLLIERKFIHSCGKVGHIEDVVVHSSYRGHKLGQRLIAALTGTARELGCYKVILDCAQENVAFYEKCGLVVKGVQMAHYMS